jgi:hypothetical protein
VIASPPALVTAVKTRQKGAGMGEHEHFAPGEQAIWTTSLIQSLPDTSFAYIEEGGEQVEGKTVPQNLRHFPHHHEDGSLNHDALQRELDRAAESPFKNFAHDHLRNHATAEGLIGDGVKVATDAISDISATLADLSLESADVARALTVGTKLGFDGQKVGVRLKGAMRGKLKNIKAAIDELLTWAENEDLEDTGKTNKAGSARRGLERARFAATIAWDGKSTGELSLDGLHDAILSAQAALTLTDRKAHKKWDPDDNGDDDSSPEGDTDHSHWDKDGNQKKPVPGKPFMGKSVKWGDERDDEEEKTGDPMIAEHLGKALAGMVAHHDAIHPGHKMQPDVVEAKAETPKVEEPADAKTRKRVNGKATDGPGYVAALKDMEATLARYAVAID